MPSRPDRICSCGARVPAGKLCRCQRDRKRQRDRDRQLDRPGARARGYDRQWDKARKAFLAGHPNCFLCGAPATIVHHAIPHKGDKALFWNRELWRPVCQSCHDGPLQSIEKGGGMKEFAGRARGPVGGPSREIFPNNGTEK